MLVSADVRKRLAVGQAGRLILQAFIQRLEVGSKNLSKCNTNANAAFKLGCKYERSTGCMQPAYDRKPAAYDRNSDVSRLHAAWSELFLPLSHLATGAVNSEYQFMTAGNSKCRFV